MEEWYRKYRPQGLNEVLGNGVEMKRLESLLENGTLPHVVLLTGPKGSGKTSVARILARRLGALPDDITEVNCANQRGIDDIRQIKNDTSIRAWGKCRVWIMDEVALLTPEAQTATLKMLEDIPSSVYFMLATTDPNKIKPTVRDRCSPIPMAPLSDKLMGDLLAKVASEEGHDGVPQDLVDRIIEVADGSARQALVLLEKALGIKDEDEALESVGKGDGRTAAFDLCKALMAGNIKSCFAILKGCEDEDPEGMRRMVLSYFRKVMLNSPSEKVFRILKSYECDYFASGKAGLVISCWEALGKG